MRKINRPECPNKKALKKDYKSPENKQALINASFGKCMYCESKITATQFGDIEHIKPKSKYPELEFNWNNLGFACSKCNNAKSDKFEEDTPFINPYNENPEDYVVPYGPFLYQKQGSERGELTIKEIDLNRTGLIEKRQEKINQIQKSINACFRTPNKTLKQDALNELKKEADKDKEYSLCIKYLLRINKII